MSLEEDNNKYFASFDLPEDSKQEMFESVDENYNDPTLSEPSILERSNLPSNTHYSSSDVHLNGITDLTDPMSDFLYSLVKMELILEKKRGSVDELKKMNDLVEFQVASEPFQITPEFQHRYATLVLYLDELNQKLKHHIGVVIHHITEIAAKYGMNDVNAITNLRRRCEDEAYELVNKLKASQGPLKIDESKFTLIAKLTSILTLLSHLQENRISSNELLCIEEVFADIRQQLHPCNLKSFEQSVEQLVSHIVCQLSPSILPVSPSVAPPSNSIVSNPNVSDVPYSS